MSRELRAKQFNPFDALKGLQEALKLKEYEHDRFLHGDLSEDKIQEISKTLLNLEKGNKIFLKYSYDNHEWQIEGICKINYNLKYIEIDNKKIPFDNILDIKQIKNEK